MVTDCAIKKLFKLRSVGMTISEVASKTKMNRKTAAKYLNENKLPSQIMKKHNWRTRENPFSKHEDIVHEFFETNSGIEAKTVFDYLQREYPGVYQDGQLRTFQRMVKRWKAIYGKEKEIFFEQIHNPGELSESDFTCMNYLNVTINGQHFEHMVYHFVLTYSNWEDATICYSENFQSLSKGLQNALWTLGKVPREHRTDCLSAAVKNTPKNRGYTDNYKQILSYYKINIQRTNPASPNENGDIEQRHHRFKRAVDQSLMLRGSRDFNSIEDYQNFLTKLLEQLNSGRIKKLTEEMKHLRELPRRRVDDCEVLITRVPKTSLIRVKKNVYSVPSRLIREIVKIYLYAGHLELWYGHIKIEEIPRLRGENKAFIQYRHIITSLIRKPGAFANYKYRQELYPTSNFRIAYDMLIDEHPRKGVKKYLRLLNLAATNSESRVEKALINIFSMNKKIDIDEIEEFVLEKKSYNIVSNVSIIEPDLNQYDELLENKGALAWA